MFLIESGRQRILVDCGQFQGYKRLRLRNWEPFPFEPSALDAVLLSHAHLDHAGRVPRLVAHGFHGPIYATGGTRDLARIILEDSARLQEEDARYLNRHGLSKHRPALPLYTTKDVRSALRGFRVVPFHEEVALDGGVSFAFQPAGHIVGAASVHVKTPDGSLFFSGDLGRPDDPIMRPPVAPPAADLFVVESTYGDRRHAAVDLMEELARILRASFDQDGVVLIPAFSVGRAQDLLILLQRLEAAHRIPDVPLYLDSPMAIDATDVYCDHVDEHRLTPIECRAMCRNARFVADAEESKRVSARLGPMIIIAGSGMMTGGRILHHVKAFGDDSRNTILLVGYQAGGTRGSALLGGARELKIHGRMRRIRARVESLEMSAHADQEQILAWLRSAPRAPRKTYLVHGEDAAADTLRRRIQDELGWAARVADDGGAALLAPEAEPSPPETAKTYK